MYLKQKEYLSLEMNFDGGSPPPGLFFVDAFSVLTHVSNIVLLNCYLLSFHTNLFSISLLMMIIYFGSKNPSC